MSCSPALSYSNHGSFGTATTEFEVSVEIYLAKAPAVLRKPQRTRKLDKHDSLRSSRSSNDLNQTRIKEKSSWLGLSRSAQGGNHEFWRNATCHLVEDDKSCVLKIFVDGSALYQTIYIHRLHHTSIRHVHRSLFDRCHCLGIFCSDDQVWNTTSCTEPIYLHFPDVDGLNIWTALLRSYASPEVYGRWLHSSDGGLYRMWRQVEMTCIQGRGLGISRSPQEDSSLGDPDSRLEADPVDIEVYCDIFVNGLLSGKTTVKKGLGSPEWRESFDFTDLPPFGNLEIIVWRNKTKPLGSTVIPLMNFRRGEPVEGWFPVLGNSNQPYTVVGELRLKIRVDEEIILPHFLYQDLSNALQRMNYLDWITELEAKLSVKSAAEHIVAIANVQNVLSENLMDLASREVDGTTESHTTLFRGNTTFTRTMETFMSIHGSAFLEASIGSVLRRIRHEKVTIETDPVRNGKSTKNIPRNVEMLVQWCQELWRSIYAARKQCPMEMRKVFAHIKSLVETRYQVHADHHSDLPWQSVSAFLFLRFIVPAILNPHLFGFWPGLPDDAVQRTVTQIAKVLQSLANLHTGVHEESKRAVKEFLINSKASMKDYIASVTSLGDSGPMIRSSISSEEQAIRKRLLRTLQTRRTAAPTLHREAIPPPQHMIDVSRHLAIITSVVVRYTRRQLPSRTGSAAEHTFDEFCQTCLEIEEKALARVSKLASKSRYQHAPGEPTFVKSPQSPTSPAPIPRRKSQRPSTAPGSAEVSRSPSVASPSPTLLDHQPSMSSSRSDATIAQSCSQPLHNRLPVTSSLAESHSVPGSRQAFVRHPRSTSTDSALTRKEASSQKTPAVPSSWHPPDMLDVEDEAGRKRKGIFRGILRI